VKTIATIPDTTFTGCVFMMFSNTCLWPDTARGYNFDIIYRAYIDTYPTWKTIDFGTQPQTSKNKLTAVQFNTNIGVPPVQVTHY
jgi:hypothetical protein